MLSQISFIALIFYIIVQRVRVTRLSKQNMTKVLENGGKLHSSNYVGFVKIFQSSWMLCMIAEVYLLDRPFIPALGIFSIIATFCAQSLRYSSIRALGDRWIHKVVTVPGTPVIDKGIYQYIRHPNWCAMMTELAVVPLFHTAYLTAIVFTLINGWLMTQRVPAEEEALIEDTNYQEVFANRPRFIPTFSSIFSRNEQTVQS
ncbi:MAG: isoprenylcysteine carboxylmethyltransferase family protein [Gloeotrichia echinulata IR180]|jgi:methyltransferase|nr:isoprenylcysteine carboxyl methyltransferase [Gloeotrichia echinulata DEX184]